MQVTTSEIISLIRRIARHPAMFAVSPEDASGRVDVLAAMALAQATGISFYQAFSDVPLVLVPLAVTDVPRESNWAVRLCDESIEPRRTSFDAFTRHTEALLEILASRGISAPDDGL